MTLAPWIRTVVAGYGTQLLGVDEAYSGYCEGNTDTTGTLTISISTQYEIGSSGWLDGPEEQQDVTLNSNGTMTITKGGAEANCSIDDTTSECQCCGG